MDLSVRTQPDGQTVLSHRGKPVLRIEPRTQRGQAFEFEPTADGLTVRARDECGQPAAGRMVVHFELSRDAMVCRLSDQSSPDALFAASGPSALGIANAIYDPKRDLAVEIVGAPLTWDLHKGDVRADVFPSGECAVRIVADLFRVVLDLPYFKPMDRRHFPRPPCGWCSWYRYFSAVTEEDVLRNTDAIAERLKPFGAELVQIDDGYQAGRRAEGGGHRETTDWLTTNERFPHGMKWLAEYIRDRGLIPGIWSVAFGINRPDVFAEHPDWFLRDEHGERIETRWPGPYVFDPTNPEVRKEWLERVYRTLVHDFGYRYLKLDGMPAAVDVYRDNRQRLQMPSEDGAGPLRLGLRAIRDAVGDDCFMLASWGTARQIAGIVDGTRTGGDVKAEWRGVVEALKATIGWYWTHGIVWYADPDVFCVREPLTIDQARAWASLLGLTGQMTLNSDDITALSDERLDIIRRVMPTADIRPVDLFPRTKYPPYICLSVSRPFESWNVVGVFNWGEEAKRFRPALEKIGLDHHTEYLVWDFWAEEMVNDGKRMAQLRIEAPPTSCRVLGLRRKLHHPQVLSTNRHVTQGAVDLLDWKWKDGSLTGQSLVPEGFEYKLFIHAPKPWVVKNASAKDAKAAVKCNSGNVWIVVITSDKTQEVRWSVRMEQE